MRQNRKAVLDVCQGRYLLSGIVSLTKERIRLLAQIDHYSFHLFEYMCILSGGVVAHQHHSNLTDIIKQAAENPH